MNRCLNKTINITTEGNYILDIMLKLAYSFNEGEDEYYRPLNKPLPSDIFTYKIMHYSILYNRCFIDDDDNEYYILDHILLSPNNGQNSKMSQKPLMNNDSMIYYKILKTRSNKSAQNKSTVDWYSFTFIFEKIRTAKFIPLYDKGKYYKNFR